VVIVDHAVFSLFLVDLHSLLHAAQENKLELSTIYLKNHAMIALFTASVYHVPCAKNSEKSRNKMDLVHQVFHSKRR